MTDDDVDLDALDAAEDPGVLLAAWPAVSAEVRRLRSEAAEARDTIALLTEEVARYDAEHGVPDLVAALDAARLALAARDERIAALEAGLREAVDLAGKITP